MHNDSAAILDDLLSRWHSWARNYRPVMQPGADPMFRNVKSGKSWDSTSDIVEDEIEAGMLRVIDFQVGEMAEPGRSAIYCHARNCCTGRQVWVSPRLPSDPRQRADILAAAKVEITRRLMQAGVM